MRPCLGVFGTSNAIQRMRFYSGNMHQLSVNSFAKGYVNNEASETASISGTISHRCDNQLRTLCALCRAMVVMSVYQHGHRWLLVWEVDDVGSMSGWLLRFPLSHFCLHCNEDNKLIAFQVGSALIRCWMTASVMFQLKWQSIVCQCWQLSISVPRLITKTFTYALHVTESATLIHRVK